MTEQIEDQEQQPTIAIQEPVRPSRVVMVGTLYHQPAGEEPVAVQLTFEQPLGSDEQLYARRIKVTEEWQPLDCSWVKQASVLVLANDEGRHFQKVPSEEEMAEVMARVIEVACEPEMPAGKRDMHSPKIIVPLLTPAWIIRPGTAWPVEPADLSRLRIRCRSGVARCVVSAVPR